MSSSNPTDGAQKNRPSLETTLKALTALLVLITASTGLFAKQQTGQKEKVEGQNSQLQEQVDTLSQKVAALQQQLDAQTATTSESPGTGTSGSTGN